MGHLIEHAHARVLAKQWKSGATPLQNSLGLVYTGVAGWRHRLLSPHPYF